MSQVHVIIAAGGTGQRFGHAEKKQFLKIGGELMLGRAIRMFNEHPAVSQIIVPLPFEELSRLHDDPNCFCESDVIHYVMGGKTRSVSVQQGVSHLRNCQDDDVVLVHDAARPLVTTEIIDAVIRATKEYGVAIPAVPLSDTIKNVDQETDIVNQTVDRDELRAVQTPQGFLYGKLKKAYQTLEFRDVKYTDEAMLMEELGETVKIVEGAKENIKITTPFDLTVAETILNMK